MKYLKYFLTATFAVLLFIGSTAVSVSAQKRGTRVIYRPVMVSPYYWGYHRYWNSWYDPYFYDPYYREQMQRNYLRNELRGNQRELQRHLEKYNADGVITAKERKELEDDYRDVARAERNLEDFDD